MFLLVLLLKFGSKLNNHHLLNPKTHSSIISHSRVNDSVFYCVFVKVLNISWITGPSGMLCTLACCSRAFLVLQIKLLFKSLWKAEMCLFNVFLDLEAFPQMSQAWETPVIWFASMCRGITMYGACFPQTLQVELSFSRTCREVTFRDHWLYLVVQILQFHIYPVIAIGQNCC